MKYIQLFTILMLLVFSGCASDGVDYDLVLSNGHEVTVKKDRDMLYAVLSGENDTLEEALNSGADVEARDWRGWTPLMLAAENGRKEMAETILKKGADVFAKDKYGRTALMKARDKEHFGVVKLLEDTENAINVKLFSAAQDNNIEGVLSSLKEGVYVDAKDWRGWTALMIAAENGAEEVVKTLLKKGANVFAKDKYGKTALVKAKEKSQLGAVELLESRERFVRTGILTAAKKGDVEKIQKMLNMGVSIDARDEHGVTLLIWAVREGRKSAVKFLLRKGANLYAKDEYGMTAKAWANTMSLPEILKILKKNSAVSY